MAKITGGEAIGKVMKAEGTEYLLTLCQALWGPLYGSCIDEGIKMISVRHEQAAGYMADGYARVTRKPLVCAVTGGPGLTNMTTSLTGAYYEGSPIVTLCTGGNAGDASSKEGESRGFQPKQVFSSNTKWVSVCEDPERVAATVRIGYRHATIGRMGPVVIEFSNEAVFGVCETPPNVKPENYRTMYAPKGSPDEVSQVLNMIKKANRPLIFVGYGIHWSSAWPELRDFAELMKIPVVAKGGVGQGYLPEESSLFAGATLFNRPSLPARIVPKTDLVLSIGSTFDILSSFPQLPEGAKVIQINIEPTELGRSRYIDLGVTADAKTFLQQLIKAAAESASTIERKEWLAELRKEREAFDQSLVEGGLSDAKPIRAARLVKEINDFLDKDTFVISDGSDIASMARQYVRAKSPGQLIWSPSNWGNMGAGVAISLGVKLGKPRNKVLLLTSDGSFGFNSIEMETASKYELQIVVVIGNNHTWASDHHILQKMLGDRYGRAIGMSLPDKTRYDKFAEALGCYGELVTEPSEIRPAINRAFESGLPSVLDVRMYQGDEWPMRTEKFPSIEHFVGA